MSLCASISSSRTSKKGSVGEMKQAVCAGQNSRTGTPIMGSLRRSDFHVCPRGPHGLIEAWKIRRTHAMKSLKQNTHTHKKTKHKIPQYGQLTQALPSWRRGPLRSEVTETWNATEPHLIVRCLFRWKDENTPTKIRLKKAETGIEGTLATTR